jgi:hypothetical protein
MASQNVAYDLRNEIQRKITALFLHDQAEGHSVASSRM